MKRRIIAFVLLSSLIILNGCSSRASDSGKPEDAINEFMLQDNLMDLLSDYTDSLSDSDNIFVSMFFSSAGFKSQLLENVRSLTYTISDVSGAEDKARVTGIITHLDISPIIDKTYEIAFAKFAAIDSSEKELPENEEELEPIILSVFSQSLKEAIEIEKPTETFSKIEFYCMKNSEGEWEIDGIPDEFYNKVLLMNFPSALENAGKNWKQYEYIG